jgi:radical SAM protein with 4Fe4S-binding SPASM domain
VSEPFIARQTLPEFDLWDRIYAARVPAAFDLELTARCNNDCRHCYVNLPAGDRRAQAAEMPLKEICRVADEAVAAGSIWCLLTGGEPLLRRDFEDVYIGLKRRGLLVSVFTNACLVNQAHVDLFKRYPPRDVEVTVYGVTEATYERVSRRAGSFAAFRRGLDLLLDNGIGVTLKAVAMRSNVHELAAIARFCRERSRTEFRFDPVLHLRVDGDAGRNAEILAERLSPQQVVEVERGDEARFTALQQDCRRLLAAPPDEGAPCELLMRCRAGLDTFAVTYDGRFAVCSSLRRDDCTCDLRRGSLAEAWRSVVPQVRGMRSSDARFLATCGACDLFDLCLWCPAHAVIETDRLDASVPYYCAVTHARAEALVDSLREPSGTGAGEQV